MHQIEGFHDRLSSERRRLKRTQADVATSAGVSTPTQVAYEQGVRSPPMDYLCRLRTLGFDFVYLMFDQSSADFAVEKLDWEVMAKIILAVEAWCRLREVEIDPDKMGEVLRLLYNECRRQSEVEPFDVGRILKLVA
jgi:transcriptional regulator with XRE-family HTH domain